MPSATDLDFAAFGSVLQDIEPRAGNFRAISHHALSHRPWILQPWSFTFAFCADQFRAQICRQQADSNLALQP